MTNRRILWVLTCVMRDEPPFDVDAERWCELHNLVTRGTRDGSSGTALTVKGSTLLHQTELYFGELLKRFNQTGQLRRPESNDTQDHHDTDQQGHDSGKNEVSQTKAPSRNSKRGRGKCTS